MLKEALFKYIGHKPTKSDTLLGTGLVWDQGETLPVDVEHAPKFFEHPTVWTLVDDKGNPVTDREVLKKDYGIRVKPERKEQPGGVGAVADDAASAEEDPPPPPPGKKKTAKKASG